MWLHSPAALWLMSWIIWHNQYLLSAQVLSVSICIVVTAGCGSMRYQGSVLLTFESVVHHHVTSLLNCVMYCNVLCNASRGSQHSLAPEVSGAQLPRRDQWPQYTHQDLKSIMGHSKVVSNNCSMIFTYLLSTFQFWENSYVLINTFYPE